MVDVETWVELIFLRGWVGVEIEIKANLSFQLSCSWSWSLSLAILYGGLDGPLDELSEGLDERSEIDKID